MNISRGKKQWKQQLGMTLVALLLFVLSTKATAADQLHLLWDIPFGCTKEECIEYARENGNIYVHDYEGSLLWRAPGNLRSIWLSFNFRYDEDPEPLGMCKIEFFPNFATEEWEQNLDVLLKEEMLFFETLFARLSRLYGDITGGMIQTFEFEQNTIPISNELYKIHKDRKTLMDELMTSAIENQIMMGYVYWNNVALHIDKIYTTGSQQSTINLYIEYWDEEASPENLGYKNFGDAQYYTSTGIPFR